MSLKKRRGPMEVVPMNKNTFKKLIQLLEKIKDPLPPMLESYLEEVMTAAICLKTHDIHKQGDVVNKAYYISIGFIMAYYFDKDGNLHVLKIFVPGDIVAGDSFMNGVPCKYYLKIFKGTYVLEVTNAQMQTGYETIPGMDELARLTLASFEQKELDRDEKIRKGSEECVLHFYKDRFDLLPPGKIIKDAFIASSLHISDDTLQRFRSILIRKGLLPDKKR